VYLCPAEFGFAPAAIFRYLLACPVYIYIIFKNNGYQESQTRKTAYFLNSGNITVSCSIGNVTNRSISVAPKDGATVDHLYLIIGNIWYSIYGQAWWFHMHHTL
jgi:hypothetical protein